MRPKPITLPEENVGGELLEAGLGDDFLDLTPRAKTAKAKMSFWDDIKPKRFCTAKEITYEMKRRLLNGRKYSQIMYLLRG